MKKKKGTNVYEKKITLGRDRNGFPIRKSITGRTISELNQRIEEAKQVWMQMNDVTESVMFSTYTRRWLENTKAVRSLNTKVMYRNIIEKYLIPEIGDLYFSEITLMDLQGIINQHAEHYNTCEKIKLTLKQIYDSAINEELAKDIKIKTIVLPPKVKKEKRPLSKDEIRAVFESDFSKEEEMFVKLLYFTGIRRAEALALKGSDVRDGFVSVTKSLIFDKNTPLVKATPKTSAGVRKVPIPNVFKEIFDYALGKDILFPMPTNPNKYMSQSSYEKFWKSVMTTMGANGLTAHIFRHNYATMLYYSNISLKKAAKLMGHEGINMIMQIYAHLDEEQEQAEEKLNVLFEMKTPRS